MIGFFSSLVQALFCGFPPAPFYPQSSFINKSLLQGCFHPKGLLLLSSLVLYNKNVTFWLKCNVWDLGVFEEVLR